MSDNDLPTGDLESSGGAAIVEFFRKLSPADRRAYDALAALDREFGEDVTAEQEVTT